MEAAGGGRREAALGALAVLPDEVLCAVVDLLPPADIGRLACVSRLETDCFIFRLGLCPENDENWQKPRQFDGFSSLYLYRRWYRCFTSLSSFSFDDGHVEREDDLLLDQFRSQYDGKGPVLLTKLAETWPARTKWTLQQLTKDFGEVPFRISQRSPQKITMKLKDYVSYMELQHDEDPLYIFDDKGACLAINVDKWYSCLEEICACHSLPGPTEDEKLPVGTGSNPVFIVSGNVIKIYAEGGLVYSVRGLGTELEFYDLLQKSGSPLINHIPEIIASGFLEYKDDIYRTVPWDGKGIPDVLAKHYPLEVSYANNCFPLGLWSKQSFGTSSLPDMSNRPIWPYMVTRKCKGDIFARIRDVLSKTDILPLASSLGVQMRNIHLLPLPHIEPVPKSGNNDVIDCDNATVLPEWKHLVSTLNRRKKSVKKHLANWGNSVPQVLIEKAEGYLPHNMDVLIKFAKDDGDLVYPIPSWIHSDIMDDNILIEGITETSCLGDPLCDIIPLHLDVFRGDTDLLREFLRSYQLPLLRGESNTDIYKSVRNSKFSRASYRAMCYCMLHEDNVLGAVFSLWKELRAATSWEDVESFIWGELNRYQESCTP
nr:unnamed protein product [Digitaria exilis]